eukprot:7603-Heterococcus_DN1.PRE.1
MHWHSTLSTLCCRAPIFAGGVNGFRDLHNTLPALAAVRAAMKQRRWKQHESSDEEVTMDGSESEEDPFASSQSPAKKAPAAAARRAQRSTQVSIASIFAAPSASAASKRQSNQRSKH